MEGPKRGQKGGQKRASFGGFDPFWVILDQKGSKRVKKGQKGVKTVFSRVLAKNGPKRPKIGTRD